MTSLAESLAQTQQLHIGGYSYRDRARSVRIRSEFLYRHSRWVGLPLARAAPHVDQLHPHQMRIRSDRFGVITFAHERVYMRFPGSQPHWRIPVEPRLRHPYSPHTPTQIHDPELPSAPQIIRREYFLWRTMGSPENLNT